MKQIKINETHRCYVTEPKLPYCNRKDLLTSSKHLHIETHKDLLLEVAIQRCI